MLNIIIYLLLAMMPYGTPESEEIIFEPSNFPSRFVEPQAMYFNQTINLVYANPERIRPKKAGLIYSGRLDYYILIFRI